MIPKIIHYVWVGNNPKPDSVLHCIDSWKKHLPDYEIIEWNDDNYQQLNNRYATQAYEYKKWAFVSDVLRIHALYSHGGIYLDTDVEVTQSFDKFLHHNFFSGHEIFNGKCLPILTAVMGAQKQHPFIADMLKRYEHEQFITSQGINDEPNTCKFTRYFENTFNIAPPYHANQQRELGENNVIYPVSHFCTPIAGADNYAIHHFNGSWGYGYRRKNKFSLFSKYTIARFNKVEYAESNELPLLQGEVVQFKIQLKKNKFYCLLKASA